ncbi:lycopene cyclase family protein [Lentzea sp. BCCO 10_0798]|jgi:lycopene beta-cyclase|uniref:Lycopene cyclase family protein n=1 Tax=Lentzea kristufekii TaxID=3095430 RepID=A0ABU4U7K1_9PSEU|nr:lycopene cyclase family protein [Lentzea sp. BCCO 10_0798]MDX8056501.1 lycopene cyclase family protein [Lentzea sp. BCCO 10_0798]
MTRIVIAGGGMSGLSLAAHLAVADHRHPVVVVDDGTRPLGNMTWASWSSRPGLLDAAASRWFDKIRVHVNGRTTVLGLGRYRYRVVRGGDLAAVVHRYTDPLKHFTFQRGHVDGVADGGLVVDGHFMRARWVFDSVIGTDEEPPLDAQLVFRGWRVSSERAVFDAEIPTLFDFRTPQVSGASFVYVLPEDAHHALVEHTAFVAPGMPHDETTQREALTEYLMEVAGVGEHEIDREEHAVLPLRAAQPSRSHEHVLTIGTQGGLLKASTGFAYQRVQRDSAAIAESMRRHGHPFDLQEAPPRFRLFDGVLLDVVTREPAQLERAFGALFRHRTAEPALRFLDEETTVPQELRLFAGMPAATYLAAARHRLAR